MALRGTISNENGTQISQKPQIFADFIRVYQPNPRRPRSIFRLDTMSTYSLPRDAYEPHLCCAGEWAVPLRGAVGVTANGRRLRMADQ